MKSTKFPLWLDFMVNIFDASSYGWKDIRQCFRNTQIAHYFVNDSDFYINILQKIKCLICISNGSQLLKHPVYVCIVVV